MLPYPQAQKAFGYVLHVCVGRWLTTCLAIFPGKRVSPSTLWFINRELIHAGRGLSDAAVLASLTRLVFRLSLLVISCHQTQPNRFQMRWWPEAVDEYVIHGTVCDPSTPVVCPFEDTQFHFSAGI